MRATNAQHRKPAEVLLSLGANLGPREERLRNAVRLLEETGALRQLRVSRLYETEPLGYTDQPDFLNLAVRGISGLPPSKLMITAQAIERSLGRQRRRRWRQREIDIDIIFYGEAIIRNSGLAVPHPRMQDRLFVLAPAAEIAPKWQHPVSGLSVTQLLELCPDTSRVRLYTGTDSAMAEPERSIVLW